MSVLVCFHAHPDDEVLTTGGLKRKAADSGHEVHLVTATMGEHGVPKPGVLNPGEELWKRRVQEVAQAAAILGCVSNEFLGYEDSGMMGEATNDNPACFWQADVEDAALRLAHMLNRVDADVLTIYDPHGLYGHPDHIQVHRVGHRAAQLAGVRHVYEATVSREDAQAAMQEHNMDPDGEHDANEALNEQFGVPRAQIRYSVNVHDQLKAKRLAIQAHRSQISEDDFFLSVPDDAFRMIFGQEFFAITNDGDVGGPTEVELLPGL
ncbi:MAG: PIG-L family deacetylase [Acidimicrobiia bacterium]|nr:PIG-L family deacetylase [Acidimicrobiia bacterium]